MLDAFLRLDEVGFLAANLVDNPHDHDVDDHCSDHLATRTSTRTRRARRRSTPATALSAAVAASPRASCTTASAASARTRGQVFWLEDAAYIADIEKPRLRCRGAGRPASAPHRRLLLHAPRPGRRTSTGSATGPEARRRAAVKRMLVRVPFMRRLNARFSLVRGALLSVPSCPAPFSTSRWACEPLRARGGPGEPGLAVPRALGAAPEAPAGARRWRSPARVRLAGRARRFWFTDAQPGVRARGDLRRRRVRRGRARQPRRDRGPRCERGAGGALVPEPLPGGQAAYAWSRTRAHSPRSSGTSAAIPT